MTTGTDPMLNVNPVLAGFVYRITEPTNLVVDRVRKPGKTLGGTWRFLLSNGVWLSAWYGSGVAGSGWQAHVGPHPVVGRMPVDLSCPEALDGLRDEILRGGC